MAKNVFQKKKRIAHFQIAMDNFTEGENKNELSDYVSSIIQTMDSNFNTLHSDCVKKYSKKKVTKAQEKDDNSTSTDFSANPMRFKGKFSASQKYPLMKKIEKIMKELKHNRRMPKPRAHLAALPKSPVKVIMTKKPHMSKKNKKLKDKSKMSNSSFSYGRVSGNDTLNSQDVNNKDSKTNNPESVCKKGESIKSKNLCRSDVKTNTKKNSLSDTNDLKDSENETTDSEYERFVKISKKGLPKKVIKKQKHSVAKTKASCDKSKSRVRKKIKKKYDSDDDVPLSSNSMKMSFFKKRKITHKVPTEIDNESDVVVNDMNIQDSSSVSDTLNNETSVTDRTLPSDEKNVCSELHEADSSYESDTTLPDISSLINKENISEVIDNVVPKDEVPNVFFTHCKASSGLDKTELNDHTPDLIIDLCDSEDDCKSSELSTVSASLEQKCSTIGDTTFGLYESVHELPLLASKKEKCKLMDAVQNNVHPDSEESDLEIIEVKQFKNSECKTDKPVNIQNQFKSTANYKENDVGGTHSQVIVKNENLGDVHVFKTEHIIKNEKTADDSKYDAVYMTNICNEFSQDKLINQSQGTLCSEYSKSLETSSKDGLLNDDDIVILNHIQNLTKMPVNFIDSLKRVKKSAHKFLKMGTEHSFQPQSHVDIPTLINTNFEKNICPVECVDSKIGNTPLVEKELKIYEGMCTSSKSLPLNSCGVIWEGDQEINKSGLIELYKKEFQTYQEIVQTEVSVGASLKLLETRQAEKVKYIRSLVQKYVETSNSSDVTLTERRQLSTSERLTDCKPSLSFVNLTGGSKSNMSQMKPFAKEEFSQDLPSSAISSHTNASKVDSDIKPIMYNFVELENAQMLQQSTVIPKSESAVSREYLNSHQCQSDKKQTLKLLNEKCNVCDKEAMAACQGCAKVFFCSHECGRKFWNDGHGNECGK